MSRPYDLLVFDWDGTLSDSEATIVGAMQDAIAALALPKRSDQQIRELIGLGLSEALQALYPERSIDEVMRLYDDYRRRFVVSSLREPPLFPQVVETLQQLHGQGYRLAIATGKSRRGLDRSLKTHTALGTLLSSSRCADETVSKPDPTMLRELLEVEAVRSERTLMIGDTEYDMEMARRASVPALGVRCGVHHPERLQASGALALLAQVAELPAWLQAQGNSTPA